MTNEDIVRIAREAGIWWADSVEMENIARIYLAAGAAAEREECAKVCDDMVLYTGFDCAAAIRARGQQ